MRLSASSNGTGSGPGIGFFGLGEVMARKRIFKRVRRTVGKPYAKKISPLSAAIGNLVWHANHAHGVLALMFAAIISKDDLSIGEGMWNSLLSDAAQRDVLLSAALTARQIPHPMYSRICWAVNALGRLSSVRNDAVHTAFTLDFTNPRDIKIVPNLSAVPPARGKRVASQASISKYFRNATADFIQLANYCYALVLLLDDPHSTWPNKPRLLSKLK